MIWPSVSCICITRNRRLFVRQTIQYFQLSAQLYNKAHTELIVLDGSDSSFDTTRNASWKSSWGVRYYHRPNNILDAGNAHNEACELSTGDIIIQWDDDDWQSPYRICRQVDALLQFPGDAFAYTSRYYWYHMQLRKACKAKSWPGAEGSTGATFAYWRDTWKKTPFENIPIGEDVPFQRSLQDRGCPMFDQKDESLLVYVRHNQNGSVLTNYQWNEEDTQNARQMIGLDLDFYDGIGELLPVANWNHPNAPGSKVHVTNPLQQLWIRHHR